MELDLPAVRGFAPQGTSISTFYHVTVQNFTDVSDECDAVSDELCLKAVKRQLRVNDRQAWDVESVLPLIDPPRAAELKKVGREYSLHVLRVEPSL